MLKKEKNRILSYQTLVHIKWEIVSKAILMSRLVKQHPWSFRFFWWFRWTLECTYWEKGMYQVCLDGSQRFSLDNDGVRLVFVGGHQAAEPRPLGQLGRGLWRRVVVHLFHWKTSDKLLYTLRKRCSTNCFGCWPDVQGQILTLSWEDSITSMYDVLVLPSNGVSRIS